MTSMRRNDVASTSFRRHVPNRFLINQCQIITFLILKYDIIENSRIELRGIGGGSSFAAAKQENCLDVSRLYGLSTTVMWFECLQRRLYI